MIRTKTGLAALVTAAALAGTAADEVRFLRETGGMIDVPRRGCVVVADCGTGLAPETLDGPVRTLAGVTRVDFRRVSLEAFSLADTPTKTKEAARAAAAVFVVDDPALPLSLVAPEGSWGVVNVAPLREGGPDEKVVARRVEKLFLRVAGLALGSWQGDGGGLMRGVATARDLDGLSGRGLTLLELRNVMNHLLEIGVTRASATTYLNACREGWAPAPTNEFQKAIWEKARADKERGPTNPITIPPPSRK